MNSETEILLEKLNQGSASPWFIDEDRLKKQFLFSDFSAAFGFMTRVAMLAEQHDHHPNWSNVYNKVDIELFTHDEGKITEKDLNLAEAIESLLLTRSAD